MANPDDDDAPRNPDKTDPAQNASQPQSPSAPKSRWSGGSWKGKSAAVAQIAKESISAAASKIPQPVSSASTPSKRLSVSDRLRTPSKSSPTTHLSLSSEDDPVPASEKQSTDTTAIDSNTTAASDTKETVDQPNPAADESKKPEPTPGWRGWWIGSSTKKEAAPAIEQQDVPMLSIDSDVSNPPPKHTPGSQPTSEPVLPPAVISVKDAPDSTVRKSSPRPRASWFGLWGTGEASDAAAQKSPPLEPTASNIGSDGYTPLVPDSTSVVDDTNKPPDQSQKTRSWAFWTRDSSNTAKNAPASSETTNTETGEIAVANTTSESDPKPAEITLDQQKQQPAPSPAGSDSRKRERPVSVHTTGETTNGKKQRPSSVKSETPDQTSTEEVSKSAPTSGDESAKPKPDQRTRKNDKSLRKQLLELSQNQLLPPLHDTFQRSESTSYFQPLLRLFAKGTTEKRKFLSLNSVQPKFRKALAIGIHGYFPGPLVAKVLGQPTGTSLRFANGAAAAIQKWADANNCPCDIEKIALEGEGMVEARVDTLWKLLLNWMDHIKDADFIMVACHSQGVPVAALLLARLIGFGCLNSNARICMCAMAGVNLGPFPSYQSRILGTGTANELFEFSRSQAQVSRAYAAALTTCLKNHVRIVFVGSIDDQLVSLESALFTTASHPYIYRAVFVDGRIHAPGFLTSLVGLACKLRNLGISDHGLIRELSGPLAGSLYSGGGHSTLYEDQSVYDLAVQHGLETSSLPSDVALEIRDYEIPTTANSNPYFLPWAMRGVLEEEFVRTELRAETDDLLKRFESWKPASKVLKDVKFRLEAVRSKL